MPAHVPAAARCVLRVGCEAKFYSCEFEFLIKARLNYEINKRASTHICTALNRDGVSTFLILPSGTVIQTLRVIWHEQEVYLTFSIRHRRT
jgi:hypothetical protein